MFFVLHTQAISYSGTIHEALMQGITPGEKQDGKVRVVKLKQGTTTLSTRTLNPADDDNSAIMVVKEVRKRAPLTMCIAEWHTIIQNHEHAVELFLHSGLCSFGCAGVF